MGRTFLVSLVLLLAVTLVAEGRTLQDRLRDRYASQLAAAQGTELLGNDSSEAQFYALRGYNAAWVGEAGATPIADSLLELLSRVGDEGLDPSAYDAEALLQQRMALGDEGWAPEHNYGFELALTRSALRYAEDVLDGRVDPSQLYGDWDSRARTDQAPRRLTQALETADPISALAGLQPAHPGFEWLRQGLAQYRALDALGTWPRVVPGSRLQPGMVDARVATVRHQLGLTGDLSAVEAAGESRQYDDVLATAVRRFQRRHGLHDDAIVGEATRNALNIPPAERAHQIALNMERWRWLPETFGDRYIVVNAADYRLILVDRGHVIFESPVIVGRDYRQTPVFSANMTYLVVNPRWEVPNRIAVEDKLPLIQVDPAYLSAQGFQVLQGWGAEARVIDPQSVNWGGLDKDYFPYRLRQRPGRWNALGRIKFIFPNRFSVYLHDTPQRELFRQTERSFSSGCIRVARPLELADTLLREESGWEDGTSLRRLLESGRERKVPLANPVPVHLLYWTAWVDADGLIHFREDIYGRDAMLARALEGGAS